MLTSRRYGFFGMSIQFLVFPPLCRKFGVLPCLKATLILYPLIYVVTPFTVLFPTPFSQQAAIFVVMCMKCWAAIFAFPCSTILLTNSAASLRLLGTLNGVATAISAIGRASGPFVGGLFFTLGIDIGYIILPWFLLAVFAIFGAIPCWWLVEMEGFGGSGDSESGSEDGDEIEQQDEEQDEDGSAIEVNKAFSQPPFSRQSSGRSKRSNLANKIIIEAPENEDEQNAENGDAIGPSKKPSRPTFSRQASRGTVNSIRTQDIITEAPETEDEATENSPLLRATSRASQTSRVSRLRRSRTSTPQRVSSPLGMSGALSPTGPSGNRKLSTSLGLSNGLGQRTTGFGAAGPSYVE